MAFFETASRDLFNIAAKLRIAEFSFPHSFSVQVLLFQRNISQLSKCIDLLLLVSINRFS